MGEVRELPLWERTPTQRHPGAAKVRRISALPKRFVSPDRFGLPQAAPNAGPVKKLRPPYPVMKDKVCFLLQRQFKNTLSAGAFRKAHAEISWEGEFFLWIDKKKRS
jgi:hypothetical protein